MTLDAAHLQTLSPADIADLLGEEAHTADWVKRTVNREGHEHLRIGRYMRFTPEQAEQFIRSFTVRPGGAKAAPKPEEDPLREQTGPSKSRNRRKSSAA